MKEVAIVGAGTAGVRAAVELDNRNVSVLMVEKNFYIGGKLAELSRIYPVCELYFAPRFFYQLNDSEHVEIMTGSEVESIQKNGDTYTLKIRKKPRYVTEKCTLCLECVKVCEKNVVYKPPFQSVPQIVFIDREKCGDCTRCADVCPEGAINFDEKEEVIERKTNAILFCTGSDLFHAERYSEYGYKRFPDVITSIELEKMLHPSFEIEFARPSDGKKPQKIAFLQCVGSRDFAKGEVYCSRICCMQALNEAKVIKERYPETDIQVFFMDLQCSGKGWEQFCETAKEMGVTCKRFRVPAVYEEGKSVYINYADDTLITEEVDMVVLSVGISPPHDTFGLPLNEFGFPEKNACGFFSHPQDITKSVEEALASISRIPGNPPHIPVETPEPGIQVFLCPCGKDLNSIVENLEKEYSVHVIDHLCSDRGIEQFVKTLKREKIVIGGCSLHENLFKRLAREKGISFVEVVPLREMRWVTEPQKDLMKMAIIKLEHLDTSKIEKTQVKIVPEVAVIGGGVSGLAAALELADTYRVYLLEKNSHLGGRALNIEYSLDYSPQYIAEDLVKKVESHSRITVLTNTEITGLTGCSGNFYVETNHGKINCGAVIVAVGADEYTHGYTHPKIITQTELEEKILKNDIPKLIVMVQCMGSRNDENPWCSAVCCSKAVSNSLKILEKFDSQILVLYRDMRTYGFQDVYYRKAREKGVLFLQNDEMPSITVDNDIVSVMYTDYVLNTKIRIEPDLLVLSTGIVPKKEGSDLAEILNISLDKNGFFRELHPKFYPVDSTREGIFICGLCHSPQNVRESITQAKAAASRVRTFLTSEYREDYTKVVVRDEACTGCSICVRVCPFKAISLRTKDEKKVATIDMSICRDCGLCVGCCPVTALYQTMLSDEQILSMVVL